MDMTSLNVSLPKTLRKYVEGQVDEGGYSTPSEYVRALIRDDQKRRAQEKLEAMLAEGLGSGEPIAGDRDYWRGKSRRLSERRRKKALRDRPDSGPARG
jgi:antitoxin ParD1/3/4